MTEKQLKHLGKKQLSELAVAQERRIRELETAVLEKEKELNDPAVSAAVPGSLREMGEKILQLLDEVQTEADRILQKSTDGV